MSGGLQLQHRAEAKRTGRQLSKGAEAHAAILDRLSGGEQASANETRAPNDVSEQYLSWDQSQKTMWALLKSEWKLTDITSRTLRSKDPLIVEKDAEIHHKIIQSLFFENLGYREGAIKEPYAKTFEWIFQEPPLDSEGRSKWSSFPNWLQESSSDVYWITGKPGAGKSTLIKFIVTDERMKSCLQKWAGDRPLCILDYYFWNAGSELQRSREGLLRTMLFQALSLHPDLIPTVVFARWTIFRLLGQRSKPPPWDFEELLQAFRTLLARLTKNGSLALFIDGLDELQGGQGDQDNLVSLVQNEMADWPNVKVCVSSRPWNIFQDAFGRNPSLKVEKLTVPDIDFYVRDHFNSSVSFCDELKVLNPSRADSLITTVVEKANGVFLWVKVVVNTLIAGLSNGDSLEVLEKTVDQLPDDLSGLFEAIWDRIEPRYHEEASQLFQILEAALKFPARLGAFVLWLSDKSYDITITTDEVKAINRVASISALKRRLSGRTKGLLEIQTDRESLVDQVDYMHRSVREWIRQSMKIRESFTDVTFDPHLLLLKGEVLSLGVNPHYEGFWNLASQLFGIASYVKDIEANTPLFTSILDRADVELTKMAQIGQRRLTLTGSYGQRRLTIAGAYDFFGYEVDGCKRRPHWSCLQARPENYVRVGSVSSLCIQTDFIGFVSQIPLASYVRAKILDQPALLFPANGILSLAEATVMTLGFNVGRCFASNISFSYKSDEERLNLLQFLLEQGADPKQLKARIQRYGDLGLASCRSLRSKSWKRDIQHTIKAANEPKSSRRVSRFLYNFIR
jgi:hypothetical protein